MPTRSSRLTDDPDTVRRDRLVASAARVWRRALDRSRPVQPELARLLARLLAQPGLAVLAPVFDGLCRAFEHALDRDMLTETGRSRCGDEMLLCRLLAGERADRCLDCSAASADLLHCALCSTRIMLRLALSKRSPA